MRILTLLFLFFSTSIFASFQMNEKMQKSYAHIINLEFDAAQQLLEIEKKENPENAIVVLQHNYIDFLTVLIGEEEAFFEIAKDKKASRIDLIRQGDESSPYYLYTLAEVHLQWAFSRLKFEEYLTAAYEIKKAYSLLEENQELFPNFKLNKKGLGLLHTLVGAIPVKYQWVISLVGMEGTVSQGLAELKSLLEDEEMEMYHQEILFLTSFLQLNMTNNEVAYEQLLTKIGEGYADNYLLNFATARLAHSLGKNELCIKVLENRPEIKGKYPFHYLDYLLGMSYLYKLEFKKSELYFNQFLANFKGNNYIKSAYHKLAWIAFLNNDINSKQSYFKSVRDSGYLYIDEDRKANNDARKGVVSHPYLLKARLFYDGGYYTKAKNELDSISDPKLFSDTNNSVEYWYRKARVNQALKGDKQQIIDSYLKAFEKGASMSTYFAPMSALQIGLIYEKNKDFKSAVIYFEKCLSISDFDYQRGIHQKAKAGIERVAN